MSFNPYPKTFTPPKEKKRMAKDRSDTTGKLRKKLDDIVRALVKKNSTSYRCFTCSERYHEVGHYMKRDNDATRWDLDNMRMQCWECNRLKDGNVEEFRKRLVIEIGEYRVSEVERKARLDIKFLKSDLESLIEYLAAKKMNYDLFTPPFYNTIQSTGEELGKHIEKAQSQQERVLNFFSRVKRACRSQVAEACDMLEVSAGRCITNLMKQGKLRKTEKLVVGRHNTPNHIYEIV